VSVEPGDDHKASRSGHRRCGSIRSHASPETQNSRAIVILLHRNSRFGAKMQAAESGCMTFFGRRNSPNVSDLICHLMCRE
jgi:hypothetical protein